MAAEQTPDSFIPVLVFMLFGLLMSGVILLVSRLLRTHRPQNYDKLSTYECGERSLGPAWAQFNIRYYIFALAFVVFDVETIFIYPWAVSLRSMRSLGLGLFAFWDMFVFVVVLLVGLYYAYRKGALKWV
ncbi:MAG TPA: NADH-quinone oxidoreductase subunit A [Armatimonadota bacterium]|nr:NADH-quinone oxidoreductase subunit A [Armatimonadota bacterium]